MRLGGTFRKRRFSGATESSIIRTMTLPANADWNLHYSRWVIDDGEPERHVGEIFEWFAVEFGLMLQ